MISRIVIRRGPPAREVIAKLATDNHFRVESEEGDTLDIQVLRDMLQTKQMYRMYRYYDDTIRVHFYSNRYCTTVTHTFVLKPPDWETSHEQRMRRVSPTGLHNMTR